jgi:KipI family sensor histidine kinase inhibitor
MIEGARLVPLGDAAVLIELEERIAPEVNARVIALADLIAASRIAGLRDIVPAYRSLVIYLDPLTASPERVIAALEAYALPPPHATAERPTIRVPVCYSEEFGPDLPAVAALCGIDAPTVAAIHGEPLYRVFMLGFSPGFAYMGAVDDRIAAPRLDTPRLRVPAGSVAIAGAQTGIYPRETPGGWRIIGRTPLQPYDPTRREPFLFTPGDQVRFYAVDRAEYDRLCAERDLRPPAS